MNSSPAPATQNRQTAVLVAVDQALSSGTNFAANLFALALLSEVQYGRFSLALTIFFFGLATTRSFALDPLLVRDMDDRPARSLSRFHLITAAAAFGLVVAIVGTITARFELTLLGIAFLPMMGLEGLRVRSFQRKRPAGAIAADAAWAIAFVALAGILYWTVPEPSSAVALLVWVLPAAFIGLLAMGRSRQPRPADPFSRASIRTGAHYASEHALRTGSLFLITLFVGIRLGDEALGFYVAARAAYGPINSGLTAFHAYFLPRHSGPESGPRTIVRSGFIAALILGGVTLLMALASRASVVTDLVAGIGEAGPGVAPLLWPVGLFVTAQAIIYPALSVLRRLHREELITRLQAVNALALVVVAFSALIGGDLRRAVWLMTAVAFTMTAGWWAVAFAQSNNQRVPATAGSTDY